MKEIELSFIIKILPKQTDVHWIEEEVLKGTRRCERCGSVLVRNGHEMRRIKTVVGIVDLMRVRLRCLGCGKDSYPLDGAMGLGSGERVTLGVRERSLWAAVEDSYEKAPAVLYIQVDGTGVNDRQGGQWMECKEGTSFSERAEVSKDRVWLRDKRSYASI